MTNFYDIQDDVLMLILLIIIVFLAILIFYVKVMMPFIDDRGFVKMKIRYSKSREEYDYWRWELKRVYLRHIPIIGRFFED